MRSEGPGLIGRITRLFGDPRTAWDSFNSEDADEGRALWGHAWPLALLAASAGLAGAFIKGKFALSLEAIAAAGAAVLLGLVMSMLAVIGFARLANHFAPRFGATQNSDRAMQLSAYSATPIFLAALTQLLPGLATYLLIAGFAYAGALVYFGLPRVMAAPRARRQPYLWSLVGIALLVGLVLAFAFGAAMDQVRALAGKHLAAPVPVVAAAAAPPSLLDNGVLSAGAVVRIAHDASGGQEPGLDPARLEGFLPQSLPGGFQRQAVTLSPGAGASQASATYASGAAKLTLSITYLGDAGANAVIGAARRQLSPRQDEAGYARAQVIEGRLAAEDVSGAAINYVMVGRRLAVNVAGEGGASIDHARAAVETIGMTRLEAAFSR